MSRVKDMSTLLATLNPGRWFTGLWRNPTFVTLWGSLTLHHFGGQVTFLALPLTAALVLNASPLEVGILTALEETGPISQSELARWFSEIGSPRPS